MLGAISKLFFLLIITLISFVLSASQTVNKSEQFIEVAYDEQGKYGVSTPTPSPTPEVTTNSSGGQTGNSGIPTSLVNYFYPRGEKTVYLTFDDGPSSNVTPKILDTLKKYNVKATFFVLGTSCEANPEILKRTFEEGHVIANHSYSHVYKTLYSTTAGFEEELERCDQAIENIIGTEYKRGLFRFPGGGMSQKNNTYKDKLASMNYKHLDWNCVNGDGEKHNLSTSQQLTNIRRYATGVEQVVLLMHDAPAKATTATALPSIIEYFQENGYIFKAVDITGQV